MENTLPLGLQNNLKTPSRWENLSKKSNSTCKTLITKPSFSNPRPSIAALHVYAQHNSTTHKTLLVDTYHQHQKLRELLAQLDNNGACPLQLLQSRGDWSKDLFWPVINFLKRSSRSSEILQVFDLWKGIEKSRINEYNYENIITLLSEEGQMDDASSALSEMRHVGLEPSLQIYNSIIHGYSRAGKFDDALLHFDQMRNVNLTPDSSTYNGLIQGYGKYKMYDEIVTSLKKMEIDGCSIDQATYNILIQEYARAGLVSRMEKSYRSMRAKEMELTPSTLIAMLEAYVSYGIVFKMERFLKRLLYSNVPLKEDLVRRIAGVYIENLMFSRLNDLGIYLSSRGGGTDMIWCLRLLSSAFSMSKKGMDCVVEEMREANVHWNATLVNIMLLAYLKMKYFTRLRVLFEEMGNCLVRPDIVMVGIVLDANDAGFHTSGILETWGKFGILFRCVEMNTDSLVLTAFGKGRFLRKCEEAYSALEPNAREKKWNYYDLMDLVAKNNGKQNQLKVNE